MRRIKIAQIGINQYSHGPELFYTMKGYPEIFDLVGYAIVENERETCKDKIAQYYEGYPELSLEEILNDPTIEAVTVETDEIHLLKYAQMAADAGKHIHMEKPGSPSLKDFERLIDTMRKTKKVFHMGYMFRYNPMVAKTIDRAKKGEFGHVFSVEAQMNRYDRRPSREWLSCFPGGMMFYLGSNLIDVIMQVQGEPSEVIPLNTSTGIDGVASEDLGFAVLRYPNAVSVVRTIATDVGGLRQIVVCGEKRTVEIKPIEEYEKHPIIFSSTANEAFLTEEGKVERVKETSELFGRYYAMITAFAEMVRGEKENPYTLDYELALFRTIMKCCGALA